ncbi:glycosyltransferase family protein [Paenibacillus frigoriresistens]|uniref:cytidylyltransferase domain-containing protein n=1 Tax=Paenibacillus alginolyticus TaxID=59839 RepID=UPI001566FCB2|nr:glycosyltransferase family protein [Paenibacillus frigoriresistens]NRF93664.1 glycosyltransferase family protein [Paenibacillus frigoriresistens]
MKIGVIIQARMGSTRLPGKVLLKLIDKSVLAHVVDRCKSIPLVNDVIIATSTEPADNEIENEAKQIGVSCYRGSETDVLSRYYEAARLYGLDVVVRVTSDCPLLDPELSNDVIKMYIDTECDYCTNTLERCYPRGLDIEVFSYEALEQAATQAASTFECEHVTPYLYGHPDQFKLISFKDTFVDNSRYRWTLDTPEDWELIQKIYQKLYVPQEIFTWKQALLLMEQYPELPEINEHVKQKHS